jgi:hypothetical protein
VAPFLRTIKERRSSAFFVRIHLIELNSAHLELHPGPQLREHAFDAFLASSGSWHFLYFLLLPHQQGSFLPGRIRGISSSLLLNKAPSFSMIPISCPAFLKI